MKHTAKFYIYRNLRTKGFSIKKRGRVIDHDNYFEAHDVTFKVNELGRQRVIKNKQKDVHAFVVTDKYYYTSMHQEVDKLPEITYNPYKCPYFLCNGKHITQADKVLFKDGKCYLVE